MPRLGLGLRLSKYRHSGNALAPLIKCGLIQYATPVTDKVGKSSRDSVRGKALVGNGSTYAKATWTQASALWDVEILISEQPTISNEYYYDCRLNGGQGYFFYNQPTDDWLTPEGIVFPSIQSNGLLFNLSDVTLAFEEITFMSRFTYSESATKNLLSLKLTNKSTGITYTLAIESRQSDGIIPLNGSDGSVILCEQFLSPATPVVNSLQESYFDALGGSVAKALGKNLFNKLLLQNNRAVDTNGNIITLVGYYLTNLMYVKGIEQLNRSRTSSTIAFYDELKTFISSSVNTNPVTVPANACFAYTFGRYSDLSEDLYMVNEGLVLLPYEPWQGYYADSLLTNPYEDGTPIITNHAYISDGQGGSVNASAQYNGRVKYDNLVCDVSGTPTGLEFASGRYIRLSQAYDGFAQYDTNRIATEADGTPKVLAYDTMLHITNNQMFATEDKQAIGFFKTALTGDCLTKTMTFFKQGEQLRDQNGDLLFDAQGNALFTLKPWVTN